MSNRKVIATIKLAPGQIGYYDEYSRIYLTIGRPQAKVYAGTNCAQLRRSLRSGRIKLVEGSLGDIPPRYRLVPGPNGVCTMVPIGDPNSPKEIELRKKRLEAYARAEKSLEEKYYKDQAEKKAKELEQQKLKEEQEKEAQAAKEKELKEKAAEEAKEEKAPAKKVEEVKQEDKQEEKQEVAEEVKETEEVEAAEEETQDSETEEPKKGKRKSKK